MNDCIEGQGSPNSSGYIYKRVSGRSVSHMGLHVLACEKAHGTAPEARPCALHSCDNKICINPEHLLWGTQSDNLKDCVLKGRHRSPAEHGTCSRYKNGCRCHPCRMAKSDYNRQHYLRRVA